MREEGPPTNTGAKRTTPIAVASFLFILFGIGMVVANPLVLAYIIYNSSAPVVLGIELLDGNSLIGVRWGRDAVIALGIVLTGVAVLGAVAGFWLRRSLKKGGKVGLSLLPFYLFFAIGFGIPALYVLVPLMTILIALGWKTLR